MLALQLCSNEYWSHGSSAKIVSHKQVPAKITTEKNVHAVSVSGDMAANQVCIWLLYWNGIPAYK